MHDRFIRSLPSNEFRKRESQVLGIMRGYAIEKDRFGIRHTSPYCRSISIRKLVPQICSTQRQLRIGNGRAQTKSLSIRHTSDLEAGG